MTFSSPGTSYSRKVSVPPVSTRVGNYLILARREMMIASEPSSRVPRTPMCVPSGVASAGGLANQYDLRADSANQRLQRLLPSGPFPGGRFRGDLDILPGSGLNLAPVGFLYLVFVVLAAVYGGFWQATAISVVSVACLDYFFDEPIFSFSVGRLSNWVELGVFEFTAVVITQLSNRATLRALEAVAERRDTARLYQTARRILLWEPGRGDPGNPVASVIREEFELGGVVLFDELSGSLYESGDTVAPEIERQTRDAYLVDSDAFSAREQSWFCVLRVGMRPVGGLALCGTEMTHLSATAIASLAAIALNEHAPWKRRTARRRPDRRSNYEPPYWMLWHTNSRLR